VIIARILEDTTLRTKELRTLLSAVLISFLAAGSARAQNTSQAEDPQPLVEKGMQAFQAHNYEQASVLFRQPVGRTTRSTN